MKKAINGTQIMLIFLLLQICSVCYADNTQDCIQYCEDRYLSGNLYMACTQGCRWANNSCSDNKIKDDLIVNPQPIKECPIGMVFIPPGKFSMGCSIKDAICQIDEKPTRNIEITKGFCIDTTEVTQSMYQKVMGANPSYFNTCRGSCPVDRVSWHQAMMYCSKIGKRLPTEAEWEYSARGGTNTVFYWGEPIDTSPWIWDKYYPNDFQFGTHPVAMKKPNPYGLYDMSDNVWEWVLDCYSSNWYSTMPDRDPINLCYGNEGRVLRGGDVNLGIGISGKYHGINRVSIRGSFPPDFTGSLSPEPQSTYIIGFRCAQD